MDIRQFRKSINLKSMYSEQGRNRLISEVDAVMMRSNDDIYNQVWMDIYDALQKNDRARLYELMNGAILISTDNKYSYGVDVFNRVKQYAMNISKGDMA